ncbi:MAG TPA: YlxR family protein [Candidatus Binatia bacterium]|nr:YlxR family protein [Candidatus Binatia bacterium]
MGCRQVRDKQRMVRLVRGPDGQVRVDRLQRAAGRGAYVCPSVVCVARGLTRNRLGHAFRQPSEPAVDRAVVIGHISG